MVALAIGGLALLAGIALLHGFAHAKPAQVKVAAAWVLGLLGVGLMGLMLVSGRGAGALWALFMLGPLLAQRLRGWWSTRQFRRPAASGPGEASGVETATLEMRLDLQTGTMAGAVRRGRFAGRELASLSRGDLLALLEDCALHDADSVPLLEAWLDRVYPEWREEEPAAGGPPPGGRTGAMTRDEALVVLGLAAGATEAEIRAAHRRLMQAAHPDRGGSDWLAARVNEARDLLLGPRN